jgi:hypothetical protein
VGFQPSRTRVRSLDVDIPAPAKLGVGEHGSRNRFKGLLNLVYRGKIRLK